MMDKEGELRSEQTPGVRGGQLLPCERAHWLLVVRGGSCRGKWSL